MVIYPETFDFTRLLEQTLDELDAKAGTHIIELIGDTPLRVYADEFRIGQVLTNLITNAIKYSPGADRIIINCSKNIENNTATISVQDFGKGIAKADQKKLFQKFERIISMNENQVSGTGLGLSIAMEIMKQHGSTIELESEEGRGSLFSFKLMLSPTFSSHIKV
jgi:two-component system, OmpR family, sensor histidine kinase VicK